MIAQRPGTGVDTRRALDVDRLGGDGRRDVVERADRRRAARRVRSSSIRSSPATSALWRRLHLTSGVALFLVAHGARGSSRSPARTTSSCRSSSSTSISSASSPRNTSAPARGTTSCPSRSPAACRGSSCSPSARAPHGATAATPRGFLVAASRARLGRVRVRILQRVGLEAAVLHPADVRAARARRRRSACCGRMPGRCPRSGAARSDRHGRHRARVDLRLRPRRAPAFAEGPQPVEILVAYGPWLKAAVAVAALGAGAAVVAFRRAAHRAPRTRFWGMTSLALSHARCSCDRRRGIRRVQPDALDLGYPARGAGGRRPSPPSAPFYQIAMYDQTVPFYLGRTTTLVAFRDELALGIDAEPRTPDPDDRRVGRRVARAVGRLRRAAAGSIRAALARRACRCACSRATRGASS